ncbi:hypothetical protein [Pseudomonas sp. NPDC088444]|uniref:hypothetical protein n=1 Tax=Pseudomonas sp. NPDC088444 TaxID=3364456 RepID=UPI00384C7DF3
MNSLTHPLGQLHGQSDPFGDSKPEFALDTSFRTAKRVDLDEHSWVEIVPGQGQWQLSDDTGLGFNLRLSQRHTQLYPQAVAAAVEFQ